MSSTVGGRCVKTPGEFLLIVHDLLFIFPLTHLRLQLSHGWKERGWVKVGFALLPTA